MLLTQRGAARAGRAYMSRCRPRALRRRASSPDQPPSPVPAGGQRPLAAMAGRPLSASQEKGPGSKAPVIAPLSPMAGRSHASEAPARPRRSSSIVGREVGILARKTRSAPQACNPRLPPPPIPRVLVFVGQMLSQGYCLQEIDSEELSALRRWSAGRQPPLVVWAFPCPKPSQSTCARNNDASTFIPRRMGGLLCNRTGDRTPFSRGSKADPPLLHAHGSQ